MTYVPQDQLEGLVLNALFEYIQRGSGFLLADAVASQLNNEFTESRVQMALRALDGKRLVRSRHNTVKGSSYEISEEGYRQVEADIAARPVQVEEAPASDRVVAFNHNQPEAIFIAESLFDLKEIIRGANDLDLSEPEKDRIARGLEVASILWDAAELKIIQFKVGILMAVEEAQKVLATTAKGVAAGLLVDAIKAFAKTHLGLDLDHI